ncbi:hypothetical protein LJY25_13190 [Hymenobacter sp. BT175]|uniref:hypothetical protein n=1 Tax=Hymenobacter translucens TaxID=2886507 RepID=UPI001D0DD18F|nr:hypothetical protein [Hymenobacter translucens]MCC2547404.1 hypothetical protein [Hymenobacter translucens]
MTRLLLTLLTVVLLAATAQAQDLLTKQNGEEVQVKVLEITPTEIKYKRTDNPDGPLIIVRRSEVFMIRYANGAKDLFNGAPSLPATAPTTTPAAPAPTTSAVVAPTYPGTPAATAVLPAPPTGPLVPGDEVRTFEDIHLSGPRLGFTVLSGGAADKAKESLNVNPFLTQFGWQFETRIFRLPNGTSGLFEVIPLIGGLEQGKFLPSVSGLIGIRAAKGLELGVGPNLSLAGTSIAFALGTSFQYAGVNFPVNLAFVPGNGGARVSMVFGFNSRH